MTCVDEVARLHDDGQRFALATVVGTWRSAPRQPGAAMVVAPRRRAHRQRQRRLRRGRGVRAGAGGDGQRRGGAAALRRQRRRRVRGRADLRRHHRRLRRAGRRGDVPRAARRGGVDPGARAGRGRHRGRRSRRHRRAPGGLAGPVGRRARHGAPGPGGARRRAAACSTTAATGLLRIGPDGERRQDELSVFVQSFAPPPRMLVFGAIDFAAAVARVGKFLGYRVTVCDAAVDLRHARSGSRRPTRSSSSGRTATSRSQQVDARTVICVLTHDPKFDVPLLEAALQTDAAYIGAMGSRRTHDDRLARLREEGVSRGGAGPGGLADRAGHRRPHAGGDRGVDRGGDRGAPLGRHRPAADRHRRPDPHRRGPGRGAPDRAAR